MLYNEDHLDYIILVIQTELIHSITLLTDFYKWFSSFILLSQDHAESRAPVV